MAQYEYQVKRQKIESSLTMLSEELTKLGLQGWKVIKIAHDRDACQVMTKIFFLQRKIKEKK